MADVVSAVRTYLFSAQSVIDTGVGQRIYLDRLPQGAELPAVTVEKSSETYDMQLSGRTGLVHTRLAFECTSLSRLTSNALAKAILRSGIDAVKGLTHGVDIRGVSIEEGQRNFTVDARDGGEDHHFVTTFDLMVSHLES